MEVGGSVAEWLGRWTAGDPEFLTCNFSESAYWHVLIRA